MAELKPIRSEADYDAGVHLGRDAVHGQSADGGAAPEHVTGRRVPSAAHRQTSAKGMA
jgi:hypothetical protein